MTAKTPDQTARTAVRTGETKAHTSWDKTLLASFLAGAYISFGAMVAIVVSSGLDPEIWGTLPTLFTGIAFLMPAAIFAGMPELGWDDVARNWVVAFLGNLVGAVVFVATSYWYLYLKDQPEDATPAG